MRIRYTHTQGARSLLLFALLAGSVLAWGQNSRFQVDTLLHQPGDSLQLTHAYIAPFSETVLFSGEVLDPSMYKLDYQRGGLLMEASAEGVCVVRYRYFLQPPPEERAFRRFLPLEDSSTEEAYVDVFFPSGTVGNPDLLEESRIRMSGSLSRGITLGSNQSLAVNSGLRLQLEGDLGDGLTIVGAITDDNIPIQPDGTTQQISDFDKIFIKLSKGPYSMTIGDYEVSHKGTQFANFYRNVQGLQFSINTEKTKATVSGAVAKGKFHTNSLNGVEGVSGPYRLTGRNGEQFFVVLAGSEIIYLNGKRMTRGENQDYIINYNTAEIYFTARHVITSITRIVVDFEYADFNYARSLLFGSVEQKLWNDRLTLRASYGRDADNPNAFIGDEEAYNTVRDSLAGAGDDPLGATTSGVILEGYSSDEVRYAQQDTLINGTPYTFYRASRDSQNAVYKILFSLVGNGQGDYVPDRSGANALVFRWVAPDSLSGQSQGEYAPVRTWVLPRLLQVVDLGMNLQVTRNLSLYSETGLSLDDINRLSSLDDEDNQGLAHRSGLRLEQLKLADSVRVSADAYYQYVGEQYVNLDRIYQAEYNRVWDIAPGAKRGVEQILLGKTRFDFFRKVQVEAEAGMRTTGPGTQAFRQVYTLSSQVPRFLQGAYSFTQIRTEDEGLGRSTRWNRHEGDIFGIIGKLKPGVEIWMEDRDEVQIDSAGQGSFSFVDLKPYLRTSGSQTLDLDLSVNYRFEREFFEGRDRDKLRATTYYGRLNFQPSAQLNLQATTSYRVFEVLDTVFRKKGLENTRVLNNNLQTTYQSKNRLLYTNFIYEVASEALSRKVVRFIEVNPGQGQYVWIDENEDGVQQIDEFQLAINPLAANFIRVIVPTRELFPTTRISFSGNFRLDFVNLFPRTKNFLKETLRNFRSVTNFRVSQSKTRGDDIRSYLVDLFNVFEDTTLLDANYNFRQDFTFFQNSRLGDLRFSFQDSRNKFFLDTGEELRGFRYWGANQRLNLSQDKSVEAETRWGDKFGQSGQFSTRNFDIDFIETRPRINFQFSRTFRLSGGYEFNFRKNTNDSLRVDATAYVHKAIVDAKWNIQGRNNIFTKLELISYRQEGETSFTADYELKQGLQPGFNSIWQLLFTFYPIQNLELSVTYDGRASQTLPVQHTGRVQVRAFF